MTSRRGGLKEFWVRNPLLDLGVVVVATFLSILWLPDSITDTGKDAVSDFLMGLSALAGVALAAETFACTMTYSSSNQFIQRIRAKHADLLRDTWTLILGGTFVSALGAICALFAVELDWRMALAGAIAGATLVLTGFARSLYWLRYTLFTDKVSSRVSVEDPPAGLPTVGPGNR